MLSGKIIPSGGTKNNYYTNKKKTIIKNLVFVSNAPIVNFDRDLKLFGHSLKLSQKLGLNLYFIDRLKKKLSTVFKSIF